jgi:hypothetical protein
MAAYLAGTGGRSSGVNYATAALFDRLRWGFHHLPHYRRGAQVFAASYQSQTGAGAGSLGRVARGMKYAYRN